MGHMQVTFVLTIFLDKICSIEAFNMTTYNYTQKIEVDITNSLV